jgi:hypothetical protein
MAGTSGKMTAPRPGSVDTSLEHADLEVGKPWWPTPASKMNLGRRVQPQGGGARGEGKREVEEGGLAR